MGRSCDVMAEVTVSRWREGSSIQQAGIECLPCPGHLWENVMELAPGDGAEVLAQGVGSSCGEQAELIGFQALWVLGQRVP